MNVDENENETNYLNITPPPIIQFSMIHNMNAAELFRNDQKIFNETCQKILRGNVHLFGIDWQCLLDNDSSIWRCPPKYTCQSNLNNNASPKNNNYNYYLHIPCCPACADSSTNTNVTVLSMSGKKIVKKRTRIQWELELELDNSESQSTYASNDKSSQGCPSSVRKRRRFQSTTKCLTYLSLEPPFSHSSSESISPEQMTKSHHNAQISNGNVELYGTRRLPTTTTIPNEKAASTTIFDSNPFQLNVLEPSSNINWWNNNNTTTFDSNPKSHTTADYCWNVEWNDENSLQTNNGVVLTNGQIDVDMSDLRNF